MDAAIREVARGRAGPAPVAEHERILHEAPRQNSSSAGPMIVAQAQRTISLPRTAACEGVDLRSVVSTAGNEAAGEFGHRS